MRVLTIITKQHADKTVRQVFKIGQAFLQVWVLGVGHATVQILLDALETRGLDYNVVAVAEGIDFELPLAKSATEFADIRLTDREVILARSDVTVSNVVEATFQAAVPVLIGGVATEIPRAYASVQATIAGRDLRFITTHLETGSAEPIQAFQAGELLQIILGGIAGLMVAGKLYWARLKEFFGASTDEVATTESVSDPDVD